MRRGKSVCYSRGYKIRWEGFPSLASGHSAEHLITLCNVLQKYALFSKSQDFWKEFYKNIV